jgi:dihydrofolate synthase/folylpolyglutamate synthase
VKTTSSSSAPKTFSELDALLQGLGMFRQKMELGRVQEALLRLDLLRPPFDIVHVVGTNGKGTTSAFIAAQLAECGLTSALYTSPHFLNFRERLRIGGCLLNQDAWAELGRDVLPQVLDLDMTYFELLTVLAMEAFRRAKVDVAVMEAGLGGTYDAVAVAKTTMTVFTPIGMDHQNVLGDTLEAIAMDKAGAVREGGIVISSSQEPVVQDILERRCASVHARLSFVDEALDVPGEAVPFRRQNARTALAASRLYAMLRGLDFDEAAALKTIASTQVPGRFQRVQHPEGELIIDTAHNPMGLAALKSALQSAGISPAAAIFSCLGDKDVPAMTQAVQELTTGPIYVPDIEAGHRSSDSTELVEMLKGRGHAAGTVEAALQEAFAHGGPVLLCGSFFLTAAYFALHPEHLGESCETSFPE